MEKVIFLINFLTIIWAYFVCDYRGNIKNYDKQNVNVISECKYTHTYLSNNFILPKGKFTHLNTEFKCSIVNPYSNDCDYYNYNYPLNSIVELYIDEYDSTSCVDKDFIMFYLYMRNFIIFIICIILFIICFLIYNSYFTTGCKFVKIENYENMNEMEIV